MFPFAACPDICPSHEAIKQRNPVGLKDIDARNIDIYLQEARSPRLSFSVGSFPSLRFWQAGAWKRVEDESEVLRQNTTRPNPRFRDRPIQLPHDGVAARQNCYGFLPRKAA